MAPKAGSKRKGKEVSREDSPPIFCHSGYPSIEAFKRYSHRTIIFGRIPNFGHLGFMNFNELMRRMGWSNFSRIKEPCYPKLIKRFYANLVQPSQYCLVLYDDLGDKTIKIDAPSLCRLVGAPVKVDEVYDSNS